ncbi:MAG: DASS family sodium-coupled anion symporter [Bacteroidales bacterium]|nr:DASS family sodium-coupled anion symporter [Bacteroidales bacterium]
MAEELNKTTTAEFDPLDMNNYRVEKLPKMEKSRIQKWLAILGGPLAVVAFVLIYWVCNFGFIDNLDTSSITEETAKSAFKRLTELGPEGFLRANYAMLAIFVAGLILWITEALPNYLTSLIVILLIVVFGVTTDKVALNQLGHPVMWLNILSFVLASMLVKTQFAKRLALMFVIKFGKSAKGVMWSFLIINIILSMFISATTVKASIMLPIFMVVCAIYGASNGKRNNFGRNLVIQNLFQVNLGASSFYTGSGANLLAISLICGASGAYADQSFGYFDWLQAITPVSLLILVIGVLLSMYVFFPMKKEERQPQIPGGLERLKDELAAMGKMTFEEWKSVGIFMMVLLLWITKPLHGIDETMVALIGAILALLPGIGVVNWNHVDIPWHLMIFSAGAYTLGSGLNATDLPNTMVNAAFNALGIGQGGDTSFLMLYIVFTGVMMFSALLFQSKNMRVMVFIPIALGVERKLGLQPMSLTLPMAMLIEHVYVLPFNSKPAALLINTNQYSTADAFKYGISMMLISWVLVILWGGTGLAWLGITPGF